MSESSITGPIVAIESLRTLSAGEILHKVAAMTTYPHTIDNGAGERITFTGRVGDRLEIENVVAPGSGPPMHVHHRQKEALTVQQGRIGYQLAGGDPQFAEAGETVVFKPGEVHKFWNAGEEELRCSGYAQPPDNLEWFLTQLYDSIRRSGGHRPNPFDAAFLVRRYRSEFGIAEIPAPVQRLVFPVVVAVGRLLGKYKRYAGAPEPVRR
jgi:quercetin dioxygenase-like cupin family protein